MNVVDARNLAVKVFQKDNVSIGFIGGSGLGKTTVAREVATSLGRRFCYMPIRSDDAMGLNLPNKKGSLEFVPHLRLGAAITEPHVIYVDEVNRADRLARQAVMELVGERSIGGEKLHPESVVLLSMNDEHDDYDVCALDAALKTRFVPVPIQFDSKLSAQYAQSRGFSRMASFIAAYPEKLNRELSWEVRLDPRFLEILDRFYTAADGYEDLAAQVVKFCLGDAHRAFLSIKKKIFEDITDPFAHSINDILKALS